MLPISVMGLIGHALSDHKRFLKNKSQVSILEQILLLEIDESSFTEIKFEFEDAHISYSINISNNSSNTTSQETNRFKKTKSKLDENKCPRSVSEILKAIEKEDNGIEKEKEENKSNDIDRDNDESSKEVHDRFKCEENENIQKSIFNVDKSYVCKYCLTYFSRPEKCRDHIKTFHENKDTQYECNICERKYKTKEGLDSHMSNKHSSNSAATFKCSTCDKSYLNKSDLIRHCKSENHQYPEGNSNNKAYLDSKCKICNKHVGRMKIHMKIYHSEKSNEYSCDNCDYKTKRKDNLLRHERQVHGLFNKRFDCIDKTFKNKKVKYKCPDCGKVFETKNGVIYHLNLRNCQELECTICGKCFKLKQHLIRHMKIHKR